MLSSLKWLVSDNRDVEFDLGYNQNDMDSYFNNVPRAPTAPATPHNVQKLDRLSLGSPTTAVGNTSTAVPATTSSRPI